jgi:hypothetical protein
VIPRTQNQSPTPSSGVPKWSLKQLTAGRQTVTVADPLPDDLREAMAKIDSHRRL